MHYIKGFFSFFLPRWAELGMPVVRLGQWLASWRECSDSLEVCCKSIRSPLSIDVLRRRCACSAESLQAMPYAHHDSGGAAQGRYNTVRCFSAARRAAENGNGGRSSSPGRHPQPPRGFHLLPHAARDGRKLKSYRSFCLISLHGRAAGRSQISVHPTRPRLSHGCQYTSPASPSMLGRNS